MLISLVVYGQANFSIEDFKIKRGETKEMSVKMEITSPVQSFQLDLVLPEGVVITEGSAKLTSWGDKHSISQAQRTDGAYRIMVMTYQNGVFNEGKDDIITLEVTATNDCALGNKSFNISNVVVTPVSGTKQKISLIENTAKVYDLFSVSATSANEKMGSVTIDPAGDAVESGTTITAKATAVDGYSFVNWTTGGTEVSTNPYMFELAADTELTANFKANQYPVVFKNEGTEVKNENIDFASVITAPENPTKAGYTFLGWYAGETKFVEGATVPVNGITYEAKWQINQYTITFDTDGGSEVAAITQDYESEITAPENPTKTGYTFAGWEPALPQTMPAENKTIKATWTINSYVVKFVADEKVVSEKTLEYGSAITAPEVPSKEGYTGAWDKEVAKTVPAEDVTYTAVYTPIDYTITFDTDGGSEVAAITLPYGSAITAPENPTKTGYTFDAWKPALPETMPVDGFQTKATWTINKYTVKFVVDEKVVSEETLDYGKAITAPEIPAKEGYTGAWDKEVAETVPAEDVTYTAIYTPIDYTITFDTDGGSELAAITLPYGSAITAPENPTKTGYTFKAWEPALPETMPIDGFKTKATWTINQYTVKFVSEGETIYEKELDYGSAITAPADPSKPGWVFIGWESEYTGTTVPAYDVTYTAQWKQDIITLRFVFWDDNKVEYQYKPGEEITEIPEVPAREGYTFKGWDKTIPEVMPEDVENGVLVITANWSVNKYVVYFIANGKTVYKQTMTYGSPIVAPEAPEVEGYTFVGWTPEVAETVPANNVWYEAVYEVNTYTVTYYVNGEVVNVAEVKYGEEIPAYEPTVEEGMKFDGWQEEIPAVMPATNLEIHGTTSGIETAIKNIVAKFGETFDVYNVSGRLVKRVTNESEISRIPAGMYIINGTKVVIRKD